MQILKFEAVFTAETVGFFFSTMRGLCHNSSEFLRDVVHIFSSIVLGGVCSLSFLTKGFLFPY